LGLKNGIMDQSAILLSSHGCLMCMNCKVIFVLVCSCFKFQSYLYFLKHISISCIIRFDAWHSRTPLFPNLLIVPLVFYYACTSTRFVPKRVTYLVILHILREVYNKRENNIFTKVTLINIGAFTITINAEWKMLNQE
jgi:hypothetical protein